MPTKLNDSILVDADFYLSNKNQEDDKFYDYTKKSTIYDKSSEKIPKNILGDYQISIISDISLISETWNMYSEIHIFKEWTLLYAYNKQWEKVFINWVITDPKKIYFMKIWKEQILCSEEDETYYLENWKKYFPKTMSEKIEEGLDDFTMAKREGFKQLREAAYTPELEKIWEIINQIIEKTKLVSLSILNKILDEVNFTKNNSSKTTSIYNNKKKKK